MEQHAAVFLDRDGTLIEDDAGYITSLEQVAAMPGVAKAIRTLNDADLVVVLITNQSVVARGMVSIDLLERMHHQLQQQLRDQAGAIIDAIYYCPFHPDGVIAQYRCVSSLRKPEPGMLLQAASDLNIRLSSSFMVGDREVDVIAGLRAGCRTVLIPRTLPPDFERWQYRPHYVAADLSDAAVWILNTIRDERVDGQPQRT